MTIICSVVIFLLCFRDLSDFITASNDGWENITPIDDIVGVRQPVFTGKVNIKRISRTQLKDPIETFNRVMTGEIWKHFFALFVSTIFEKQNEPGSSNMINMILLALFENFRFLFCFK